MSRVPATAGEPRPRATRERQRQRLIDACISALHVHGPSNTTIEKVVAIARMSPGIVRFYFDSKAALLVASLEHLAAEFEEKLLVPVSEMKATPVAALERLVELYLGTELATARKVSVWYSFWGEASSRQEYHDICGTRDERFELLVRELMHRLIDETQSATLDPDAVSLGLIGVLEMLWQGYAFQTESTIDRAAARRRCLAYLRSVFPGQFGDPGATRPAPHRGAPTPAAPGLTAAERAALFDGRWCLVGAASELDAPGACLTGGSPGLGVVVVATAGGPRAFRNACVHRPHALVATRRAHLSGFECARHGCRHALDGTPVAGTLVPLAPLEVATRDGWLYVRRPGERSGELPALEATVPGLHSAAWPARLAHESTLAADWRLLVEQWLDLPGPSTVDGPLHARFDVPLPATWSAHRLQRLAPDACWRRAYLGPNQLLESLAGAVLLTEVAPEAAGLSRVRFLAYAAPGTGRESQAATALAHRLLRARARADLALAASTQCGLAEPADLPHADGLVPPALASFRQLIARLHPGARRAPGDPP